MKVIYNNFIPFKGFVAINIFGTVFARREFKPLRKEILNHEAIHSAQIKEMLYIGFYLWFLIEWVVRLFINRKTAYRSISFEQEAYRYECVAGYLKHRKKYAWFSFCRK